MEIMMSAGGRRGRKRNNSQMSTQSNNQNSNMDARKKKKYESDNIDDKTVRNAKAAKQNREKKKEEMALLRQQVAELLQTNEEHQRTINELKSKLQASEKQRLFELEQKIDVEPSIQLLTATMTNLNNQHAGTKAIAIKEEPTEPVTSDEAYITENSLSEILDSYSLHDFGNEDIFSNELPALSEQSTDLMDQYAASPSPVVVPNSNAMWSSGVLTPPAAATTTSCTSNYNDDYLDTDFQFNNF